MKAAVVHHPDLAPAYGDFPDPPVSLEHSPLRVVAAGIHPLVRARAAGTHYSSEGIYPHIPGVDGVGLTEHGSLVYVVFPPAPYGTFADFCVTGNHYVQLPEGVDALQVAAGINPGLSSWMPFIHRLTYRDTLGTVLILGATGNAGVLAVHNARLLGADRIIAVGRNPAALEHTRTDGATDTVALTGEVDSDTRAMASALSGDRPSTVLDFVWGQPAQSALALFQERGAHTDAEEVFYIQIGSQAGAIAAVPAQVLRSTKIRVIGSGFGSFSFAEYLHQVPLFAARIAEGSVHIPHRAFPLPEIGAAWDAARQGRERVVVVPHSLQA